MMETSGRGVVCHLLNSVTGPEHQIPPAQIAQRPRQAAVGWTSTIRWFRGLREI